MGQQEGWPFGNSAQVIAKKERADSCWANETVTTHEGPLGRKEKSGRHKQVAPRQLRKQYERAIY
jgi:hypothetical protein